MFNRISLSPQAGLVPEICAVFFADKNLFLRTLRKEPLYLAFRQERNQIQPGITIIYSIPFTAMKNSNLFCPLCRQTFHHRVKRSWFLKYALCFMPFRVYFCERCEKNVYVRFKDQPEMSHKPAW
jgi:hypothetical protein